MDKRIGRKATIILGLIGVILAYIFMNLIFIHEPQVPFKLLIAIYEYRIEFIIGILGGLLGCYYFGGLAGILIRKKNISPSVIGIFTSFIVLYIGITCSIVSSYFISNSMMDWSELFSAWVFSIFWFSILGGIQTIILGVILGRIIKRKKVNDL